MPKNKSIVPNAPVLRLMKIAGARRISAPAVQEVSSHTQSEGLELARRAVALAKHAGRSTVNSEDIRLAQTSKK